MTSPRKPSRLIVLAAAGAVVTLVALTGGCSGGGDSGGGGGILESIFGTSAPSSTQPSQPHEPMTLFEKRRLVARLQQDPRALQRMTPRERREVAAMVAAAESHQDEDERD